MSVGGAGTGERCAAGGGRGGRGATAGAVLFFGGGVRRSACCLLMVEDWEDRMGREETMRATALFFFER